MKSGDTKDKGTVLDADIMNRGDGLPVLQVRNKTRQSKTVKTVKRQGPCRVPLARSPDRYRLVVNVMVEFF